MQHSRSHYVPQRGMVRKTIGKPSQVVGGARLLRRDCAATAGSDLLAMARGATRERSHASQRKSRRALRRRLLLAGAGPAVRFRRIPVLGSADSVNESLTAVKR